MEYLKRRGQQEIVGFVLIVVLVMVALMIFLVISVRDDGGSVDSVGVSNMLDVIMRTTTDCAIIAVPKYDSFEDLFKSCHDGDDCSNLDVSACDYLNESLGDVVSSMVLSDAMVGSWELDFFVREGEGILKWDEGNCTGQSNGAQRSIVSHGESLVVRMRICSS
ncbi:hypothetical protein HN903_03790 [archaeon]|jgi:hypothetical protein|nr:hypothetical protein [archaeon]MBT7128852.1 hypothetical protein [archaeon]